ncbi:MAG: hypothetical protein D3924_03815 [Candidatus Electrothrix sp. AR4]|nr:hypothetical protein [Candidatus Electrothrix sp. AR4]
MTWQETGSFIVERIVATIIGLVIIAIFLPTIVPPEMLPADVSWLERYAKPFYFFVVFFEVALVFQYWSEKVRKMGWVLLGLTFALVVFA